MMLQSDQVVVRLIEEWLMRQTLPPWWANSRGEWYVIVQFVLFCLIAVAPLLSSAQVTLDESLAGGVSVFGVILMAFGGGGGMIGVLQLGDNLSVFPRPKAGGQLIENGMYALVRHPIYCGLIISAVGWALFFQNVLAFALAGALFVFFDTKSRREERWLCEQYPAYAAYQKRIKKLIPFLY